MTNPRSVDGYILAGGHSRRMGSPKALLDVAGRSIIARVAEVLSTVTATVTVVTDRPEEVDFLKLPTIPDRHRDCGPLGGLHAALSSTRSASVLLVSCDLPLLTPEVLRALLARHGGHPVTAPRTDRIHPVCAVYDRSVLPLVERRLAAGHRAMQGLIEETGVTVVDLSLLKPPISPSALANVNTPGDLAVARELAG